MKVIKFLTLLTMLCVISLVLYSCSADLDSLADDIANWNSQQTGSDQSDGEESNEGDNGGSNEGEGGGGGGGSEDAEPQLVTSISGVQTLNGVSKSGNYLYAVVNTETEASIRRFVLDANNAVVTTETLATYDGTGVENGGRIGDWEITSDRFCYASSVADTPGWYCVSHTGANPELVLATAIFSGVCAVADTIYIGSSENDIVYRVVDNGVEVVLNLTESGVDLRSYTCDYEGQHYILNKDTNVDTVYKWGEGGVLGNVTTSEVVENVISLVARGGSLYFGSGNIGSLAMVKIEYVTGQVSVVRDTSYSATQLFANEDGVFYISFVDGCDSSASGCSIYELNETGTDELIVSGSQGGFAIDSVGDEVFFGGVVPGAQGLAIYVDDLPQ